MIPRDTICPDCGERPGYVHCTTCKTLLCLVCARANDGQCRAHATAGEAAQEPAAPHVLIEFWRDEIAYRVVQDGETRRLQWHFAGVWTLDRTCDMKPEELAGVLHEEQADLIAMRAGHYDRVTPKVLVSLRKMFYSVTSNPFAPLKP